MASSRRSTGAGTGTPPAAETARAAGLRYRVLPSVILDAAVSYMPLEATPNHVRNDTNLLLPASVKVDPLTVSIGAAWRF